MHLYLRTFYNIVRIQNKFEWTVEHQKHFDEINKRRTIKAISHSSQPFYATWDASTFEIGAKLLQKHQVIKKKELNK